MLPTEVSLVAGALLLLLALVFGPATRRRCAQLGAPCLEGGRAALRPMRVASRGRRAGQGKARAITGKS